MGNRERKDRGRIKILEKRRWINWERRATREADSMKKKIRLMKS